MEPREPTADECSQNAKVFQGDGASGYAIWYPQMGGYVGKAVAVCCDSWEGSESGCRTGGCIDVYVWHDGEFPFSETDGTPKRLHHCDPEQFIEFGETLKRLNEAGKVIA